MKEKELVPTTVNVDKRKYDKMERDIETIMSFMKDSAGEMMITESDLRCWDVNRSYNVICDKKLIDFIKGNVTYEIAKEQQKKYSQINYNLNTDLDRTVMENDRLVYQSRDLNRRILMLKKQISVMEEKAKAKPKKKHWYDFLFSEERIQDISNENPFRNL